MFENVSATAAGQRLKQAANVFFGVALMGGLFMLGVAALAGIGFVVAVVVGGPTTDWQVLGSYLALSAGVGVAGVACLALLRRLPGPTVAFV
ncbi:hypothetical protein [Halovenus salina]|uniref:Major facilitator superfamily (MFS) profile domain-containing protein n=1 Tax=Halovenus salina TaxID=1510225 RepID=A0ABD5W2V3_9EURY|nr:hypothetical protein [Halovenus salina]